MFDVVDGSPFLELKQTLQAPVPLTCRLETLMPFSKGFIVAGGGINGYLGVYENMVCTYLRLREGEIMYDKFFRGARRWRAGRKEKETGTAEGEYYNS